MQDSSINISLSSDEYQTVRQSEKGNVRRSPQKSPKQVCPRCGSENLKTGAGLRPNQESRRCNNCQHFLGFSTVSKLKAARRRKELTECLQILENSGIQGEMAIFSLSLATDGGES